MCTTMPRRLVHRLGILDSQCRLESTQEGRSLPTEGVYGDYFEEACTHRQMLNLDTLEKVA
jgi:hypothetical protein